MCATSTDFPVPRITYSSHKHRTGRLGTFRSRTVGDLPGRAGHQPGGAQALVDQLQGQAGNPLSGSKSTAHIMGTARMGESPDTSVVDRFGRMHELDNVHVADARCSRPRAVSTRR